MSHVKIHITFDSGVQNVKVLGTEVENPNGVWFDLNFGNQEKSIVISNLPANLTVAKWVILEDHIHEEADVVDGKIYMSESDFHDNPEQLRTLHNA